MRAGSGSGGRLARADFGGHKGRARVVRLHRWEIGQAPVGVAQIGDDALAAGVDHQRGGHDAAHDDAAGVCVLERRQQIPDERHGLRDRARATPQCIGEAFAFDPVRRAIGERRDLAGGVDMANRGMVELGERFGLAHEPGASRRLSREMHANGDRPLQHAIPAVIQRAIGGHRDEVLEPECRLERPERVVEHARRRCLHGGIGDGRHVLRSFRLARTPGTRQIHRDGQRVP